MHSEWTQTHNHSLQVPAWSGFKPSVQLISHQPHPPTLTVLQAHQAPFSPFNKPSSLPLEDLCVCYSLCLEHNPTPHPSPQLLACLTTTNPSGLNLQVTSSGENSHPPSLSGVISSAVPTCLYTSYFFIYFFISYTLHWHMRSLGARTWLSWSLWHTQYLAHNRSSINFYQLIGLRNSTPIWGDRSKLAKSLTAWPLDHLAMGPAPSVVSFWLLKIPSFYLLTFFWWISLPLQRKSKQ